MKQVILNLFTFHEKLKFNEIEKLLKQRSNKLAYHLNKFVKKGVLEIKNKEYSLTPAVEYIIPYLSDKKAVLPIIIVHIGNSRKAFLYKRKKRPFKDKLSLPGGRMLLGESISQAAKRIMKEKHDLNIDELKIKSVSLEHLKRGSETIHTFFLILIKAKAKEANLTKVKENKRSIISSDYNLIANKNKDISIPTIVTTNY